MTDANMTNKPKRGGFSKESHAKAVATRAANRAARIANAAPIAQKPAAQFAGLTVDSCPTACNAQGCIFVEKPYCAHPYKGGPQGTDISRPSVIARINEAKRIIGKRKLDVRYA